MTASSMYLRAVIWSLRTEFSTEYCTLSRTDDGFQIIGYVTLVDEDLPTLINYFIHTDLNWHTQRVDLDMKQGDDHTDNFSLLVDAEKRWWKQDILGREEIVACRGCIDVDLSFSPSTNTLAMQRLALKDGESQTITTAWVQLPDLTVSPFPQQYTRLSAESYLFTSLMDDFKAHLHVDEAGLVADYEGLWRSVAGNSGDWLYPDELL